MVILYYRSSSKTSRQSIAWFTELEIEVTIKQIEHITKSDLIHVLSLSENGFSDVLKRATGRRKHMDAVRKQINCLNFNDAVDFLLNNRDVIKVPIIFDKHRLLIGYNTESIRIFITTEHRKSERALKKI